MISNMPDEGLILAVDGPSGTGKSTTCRALAKQLDAKYIDTGAMYRVATLAVLRQGVDPADKEAVISATANLPLEVSDDPDSTSPQYLPSRRCGRTWCHCSARWRSAPTAPL